MEAGGEGVAVEAALLKSCLVGGNGINQVGIGFDFCWLIDGTFRHWWAGVGGLDGQRLFGGAGGQGGGE